MSNIESPWCADAAALPAGPGAYALRLRLAAPAALPPAFGAAMLPAGWYVYLGSARGPGGLRARCGRHLRRDKGRRWHIDWLTTAPQAEALAVLPVPGGEECVLRAILADLGCGAPVPRFGASDCRTCDSHMVALDQGPRKSAGLVEALKSMSSQPSVPRANCTRKNM